MAEERYEPKDETFQFSDLEEGSSSPFDSEGAERPSIASIALRRYVLYGIALLILVWGVYRFFGTFFPARRPAPPRPVVTQPVPVQPQVRPATSQLEQRLQRLEAASRSRSENMNQLTSTLNNLNSTLKNLESRISDLSYNLQTLDQKVDQQQSQLQSIQARLKKPRKRRVVRRRARVVKPKLAYKLQAVIPGRAWLISSKGTTITISEGSRIPGYGTVTLIDAEQGIVKTSRDKVFDFSPNSH